MILQFLYEAILIEKSANLNKILYFLTNADLIS